MQCAVSLSQTLQNTPFMDHYHYDKQHATVSERTDFLLSLSYRHPLYKNQKTSTGNLF